MRQPLRKKPTLADEITRTLRAYDILREELARRQEDFVGDDALSRALVVAERIAARTADD